LTARDSLLDSILSAAQLPGLRERDEVNGRGLWPIGGDEDAVSNLAMMYTTPSTGGNGHLLL